MKNFKDFISEEKPNIKRKAKGEQDFVDAHEVEVTDPENSGTEGPAKVTTKAGSGKRKADKDNKQEFGEETELTEEEILALDEAKNPLDHGWKSSKEPGVMTRQKVGEGGHREYKIKHAGQTVQFKVPFTQDKEHGLSHHLSKIDHEGIRKHLTKKHGAAGRNSSTLFGASHSDIVSGAKEYMEKSSVKKEEVELDEAKVDRGLSDEDKVAARAARGHISRAVNPGNTSGGQFRGKGPSPYKDAYVAKQGPRKGKITQMAIDRTKDKIKSRLNMEEAELDEAETPFTPDKPKKSPSAVAGKYGQGPSTAKHLAKQGMQKTLRQMKKSKEMKNEEEEVEEKYVNPGLEKLAAQKKKTLQQKRKPMQEADFSKKETKMAHTIGKEFEKKGVGDESKGGPYAVASAMVRDRPEVAKKAYKTIQSKMKEEADAELLFNLYNDLNEENQEMFMSQLEEDADSLLEFARMMEEE